MILAAGLFAIAIAAIAAAAWNPCAGKRILRWSKTLRDCFHRSGKKPGRIFRSPLL
jgi:hypothetical protein